MAARSSLVTRLVVPVVCLVLAAVLANVAFSAWWAAQQSARAAALRRGQVAAALEYSRIPLSPPVLTALHQLTGDHYCVWDAATAAPAAATLAIDAAGMAAIRGGADVVPAAGTRFRLGMVRSGGVRPEIVYVLSPIRPIVPATLEAVWPVLAVAAATLAVLVPLGLWTTRRLAARIGEIDRHVARITAGEFGQALPIDAGGDPWEIARLVGGVNDMSDTLATQRDSLVAGERQRLLGQLAAGFAHELRNAVTGARLAIDIHRRRCPMPSAGAADESLTVAVRQLDILEEEVRGLLTLGRPTEAVAGPVDIDRLLAEVVELVSPRAGHAGVRIESMHEKDATFMGHREGLRAALVNLMLNGIDAAGAGGGVELSAVSDPRGMVLAVDDTGPGPDRAVRDSMLEPFVTSKPEGIGLGLAVARSVAEAHAGRLEWSRTDGRTRFAMVLPATPTSPRADTDA